MATILVVDDDPHILELVRLYLTTQGWTVEVCSNGESALRKLTSQKIDLMVLDIMMPGMDGFALCKAARSLYPKLSMLMLTAKGDTTQKIKGFQVGTDDYLVKPFDAQELIMRIRALMRRSGIQEANIIRIGNVSLNRAMLEVLIHEQVLLLPLKEFELLFMLASSPGQIFSRDQLIEQIWGFDYDGDHRTVDVHVKRLRERLSDLAEDFEINTVRGLGYRVVSKR